MVIVTWWTAVHWNHQARNATKDEVNHRMNIPTWEYDEVSFVLRKKLCSWSYSNESHRIRSRGASSVLTHVERPSEKGSTARFDYLSMGENSA